MNTAVRTTGLPFSVRLDPRQRDDRASHRIARETSEEALGERASYSTEWD
jgi:hypothetical protein